jgi:hypothetical protein
MTPYELEVSAYAAAHKIYSGLPAPDRPCPGGYRSRMIDQIADTIKQTFQADPGLASSYRESSPGEVSKDNREWRFWMQMPHAADIREGGFVCLRCGQLALAEVHEMARTSIRVAFHNLTVERSEFDVERASD